MFPDCSFVLPVLLLLCVCFEHPLVLSVCLLLGLYPERSFVVLPVYCFVSIQSVPLLCFACVLIFFKFLSRASPCCVLPVYCGFLSRASPCCVLPVYCLVSIQSVPLLCFACLLWVSVQSVPLLCFACLLWVSIQSVPLLCFACLLLGFYPERPLVVFCLFIVGFYPERPLVVFCLFIVGFYPERPLGVLCLFIVGFYQDRRLDLFCLCVYLFLISIQSVPGALLCFIYLLLVSIKTLPLLCCTCVFIVCFCPDRPLSFVLPLCIVWFLSRTSPLFLFFSYFCCLLQINESMFLNSFSYSSCQINITHYHNSHML